MYNPYYYGYGYGYGGYGYGGYDYQDMAEYAYDPDQLFTIIGASIGHGKRLEWPDDYFYIQGELGYQCYKLKTGHGTISLFKRAQVIVSR